MIKPKLLFACCIVSLLSACAGPKHISISKETQEKINVTDMNIVKCKKDMTVEIDSPQSSVVRTGGGFTSTLIDFLAPTVIDIAVSQYRYSNADEAAAGIQQLMTNIDIQETLNQKLIPVVQKTPWLKTRNVKFVTCDDKEERNERLKQTDADALFEVIFKYKLNHTFKEIEGQLFVTLHAAKDLDAEIKKGDPIFKTELKATKTLPSTSDDIEVNSKYWESENGNYLRETLDDIIQRLVRDLEFVLKKPECLGDH